MTILTTNADASRVPHARDDGDAADAWALDFFGRLLARQLGSTEFDAAVQEHWRSGRFILRAPRCAAWLRTRALEQSVEAGYGRDAQVRFRSHWLVGTPGRPGAIHLQAPAERLRSSRLVDKNRRPHQHDGSRIALITSGRAILHLGRADAQGRPQRLDCPVHEGDLALWPAWVTHTFDALDGFWLVSAMSAYVDPSADGFAIEPDPDQPSLDQLSPRHCGGPQEPGAGGAA